MGTLVYAPGVRVVIDTFTEGLIDVTDDITAGSVNRIEDGVSSASISLANHRRKYDRIFTPNDRISIRMKRINWMVVFTGYLNRVPYFSAYTRTVNITASCSLKRVQYYLWDPYAPASAELMNVEDAGGIADGGMKKRAITLLEDVVGWSGPSRGSRIHIGKVPSDWLSQVDGLYATIEESLQAHQDVIGADPSIGGQVLTGGLGTSTEGIPGNWATGKLPYSGGKMTWFGGPQGGAYGKMQLTGESGRNPGVPEDPQGRWYMAMRWPYFKSQMAKNRPNVFWPSSKLTRTQFNEAVQWWRKQRILVRNKRTGIAVVLRPADWGPAEWTGNGVDVAEYAYDVMDTKHGDEAQVMFAPLGAELGPYTIRDRVFTLPGLGGAGGVVSPEDGSSGGPGSARGRGAAAANVKVQPSAQSPYPVPPGIQPSGGSFSWGGHSNGKIPEDRLQTAVGSHRFHPIAADAFVAMRNAMKREANMTLSLTDSYRTYDSQVRLKEKWRARGSPHMAATPGTSNHGWGFATDLALPGGNSFSSRGYLWMKENASRFGWVNPPWALPGQGQEEPWHWEFWGIFNYNESTIDTAIPSLSGEDSGGLTGGQQRPLFNGAYWTRTPQRESSILSGPLSLMNDEPVMNTLRVLMNASGRKFCSAPNGDLIAWFPDYFGAFGTAGKMKVRTIEVEDFTIDWDDQRLKTHMFVTGAVHGSTPGGQPGGPVSTISKFMTHGVASVEYPELVETLINVEKNTLFADGARILRRFGPRVEHQTIPTISDRAAEFWYAVHLFRQNWAEQFSASVPLSFMPELYPGMIIQIEELNFQAYVKSVSHDFNFNDGGGFSTRATLVAPATMSGSDFKELPRVGSDRRASMRSGTGD